MLQSLEKGFHMIIVVIMVFKIAPKPTCQNSAIFITFKMPEKSRRHFCPWPFVIIAIIWKAVILTLQLLFQEYDEMAEEQLRIEEKLEELEDNPPRYVCRCLSDY